MKVMMFEDAEDAILSKFISSAYKGQSEICLYFSGGNSVLRSRLCEIYNDMDTYIVYIDLVPDNYNTRKEYMLLMKTIRRNKFRNVYVLPIICIEYYVMKAFFYKTPAVEAAISCGNYKQYRQSSSFEKYCKFVLNTEYMACMHTDEEYNTNAKFGWFYLEDCLCNHSVDGCKEIYLLDKSKRLIRQLPAFYEPSNWNDGVKNVDLGAIHNYLIERYNEIVSKYTALGLIDEHLNKYTIE